MNSERLIPLTFSSIEKLWT